MKLKYALLIAAGLALAAGCGQTSGVGGSFQLVEFLSSDKDSLPRNEVLTFRFSTPVDEVQDFAERIKIRNVGGDATRAIGSYVCSADVVTFLPRLPEQPDRSDAGLRADATYSVYLMAGPDALRSTTGDVLGRPQEFGFETSEYFTDPFPDQPPRALGFFAVDPQSGFRQDLSRADVDSVVLSRMDSAALLAENRIIEPGAGGAPDYAVPWEFELLVDEPLDPQTVTPGNVRLVEIYDDALTGPDTANAGHFGDPVEYLVPISVQLRQRIDAAGAHEVAIRVRALQTLRDDARYRLSFSGTILGIDFRKTFIGDNGLAGDGLDQPEPGGMGYVTEFLVYDRPAILASHDADFAPILDGIDPETGATTLDPDHVNNRVPFDPPTVPSCAVGIVPAWGDGSDGELLVGGSATVVLDTGDTPNGFVGDPFTVPDPDPLDTYSNNGLPAPGSRQWLNYEPTEWNFTNVTVASASTLKVIGVNPARIRATGLVLVSGTLDAAGGDGLPSSATAVILGGAPGAGGFRGGDAYRGDGSCSYYGSCSDFGVLLANCSAMKAKFPFSLKGEGPGRGGGGGDMYQYPLTTTTSGKSYVTGTGGGGAGHAYPGGEGEDRQNSGTPGSPGDACSYSFSIKNSSVIGLRGHGGSPYGDAAVRDVFVGGSGGGAGGGSHMYASYVSSGYGTTAAGGSGGGGGGALEILAAAGVHVPGTIDVSGGDGGDGGTILQPYTFSTYYQYTGAGGGGSGGTLVLVSAGDINVSGGTLNARGGPGGNRAGPGTTGLTVPSNAGGDGAPGFILLMDPDGVATGLPYATPGEYPAFGDGYLTLSLFEPDRFGEIRATTELFRVGAPNPRYTDLDPDDIDAFVAQPLQRLRILMSSARADAKDPLLPDLATETPLVEVATVDYVAGAPLVTIVPGAAAELNPAADPDRRSFVRVMTIFEYNDATPEGRLQPVLGPYAFIDRVTVRMRFNE